MSDAVLADRDLWLGHEGAALRSMDSRTPVMCRGGGGAAHNLAALRAVHDPRAGEVLFVGEAHADRVIGHVGRELVAARWPGAALLPAVWSRMTAVLPSLPWPDIVLIRGDEGWPRAFSLPGAVVVKAPALLHSAPLGLLYLTHELVHQWLGALMRMPDDAASQTAMEANVDAVAWFFVATSLPRASPVYQRLFQRYAASDKLTERARITLTFRRDLDERGPGPLVEVLDEAARAGGRLVYDPAAFLPGGVR